MHKAINVLREVKIPLACVNNLKYVFSKQIGRIIGDSNEAKIRVAEYSTILFQQGQFLSRVRPTEFKANIVAKIE